MKKIACAILLPICLALTAQSTLSSGHNITSTETKLGKYTRELDEAKVEKKNIEAKIEKLKAFRATLELPKNAASDAKAAEAIRVANDALEKNNKRIERLKILIKLETSPPGAPHTVELTKLKGDISLTTSNGIELLTKDLQEGRVAQIESGTRIKVGPNSHLSLTLPDGTAFTLGEGSDMTIDEFVYDPEKSIYKTAINFQKGIFRFITGTIARKNPERLKITMPVGFIGIRGTDFVTTVHDDGSSEIKLFSGELEITPKKSSIQPIILKAKHKILISSDRTPGKIEPLTDLDSKNIGL